MIGPIIGRGETEITRTGIGSQVVFPWKIWVRSSLASNIAILCVYLVAVLIWLKIDADQCWQAILDWYLILLAPLPLSWVLFMPDLVFRNYRPKQLNQNWPPPFAQVNALEVGGLTWHNADQRMSTWEPPPDTYDHRVVVEEGKRQTIAFIPATPEWQQFSRYIVRFPRRFTESKARQFKIPMPQFRKVYKQFLDRDMSHWKNPSHHASGVVLHPSAVAVLKEIANES